MLEAHIFSLCLCYVNIFPRVSTRVNSVAIALVFSRPLRAYLPFFELLSSHAYSLEFLAPKHAKSYLVWSLSLVEVTNSISTLLLDGVLAHRWINPQH